MQEAEGEAPVRRLGRRRRNRKDEDHWTVTAGEPDWEMETAGLHLPNFASQFSTRSTLRREDSDLGGGALPRPLTPARVRAGLRETLRGDVGSIALLLLLYLLQGIPLGLIASIPLVLQSRHVTYAQQAVFTFAYWPFSMKLIWAPIVDTWYSGRLGRRKSWLVPTQYLLGLFMLFLGSRMDYILSADDKTAPINVYYLTAVFLPLNFLAATQDIAVDGWALTMLSRRNVGYASTCNAVGQTAGFFLGNVVFLSLESAEFSNRFLRTEPKPYGVVTLADFMSFWGWVFLVTTTLVLIFKREVDHRKAERDKDRSSLLLRNGDVAPGDDEGSV